MKVLFLGFGHFAFWGTIGPQTKMRQRIRRTLAADFHDQKSALKISTEISSIFKWSKITMAKMGWSFFWHFSIIVAKMPLVETTLVSTLQWFSRQRPMLMGYTHPSWTKSQRDQFMSPCCGVRFYSLTDVFLSLILLLNTDILRHYTAIHDYMRWEHHTSLLGVSMINIEYCQHIFSQFSSIITSLSRGIIPIIQSWLDAWMLQYFAFPFALHCKALQTSSSPNTHTLFQGVPVAWPNAKGTTLLHARLQNSYFNLLFTWVIPASSLSQVT